MNELLNIDGWDMKYDRSIFIEGEKKTTQIQWKQLNDHSPDKIFALFLIGPRNRHCKTDTLLLSINQRQTNIEPDDNELSIETNK